MNIEIKVGKIVVLNRTKSAVRYGVINKNDSMIELQDLSGSMMSTLVVDTSDVVGVAMDGFVQYV